MRWTVVTPFVQDDEPIRLANEIATGSRSCRLDWVSGYHTGADWNAAILRAWDRGVDFVLLLEPGTYLSRSARIALIEAAPTAPYLGFKAQYVMAPDGVCRYIHQPPRRVGEPIDAVRVLSRAALERVAGQPFAARRKPKALWMTRRLGRYGIRPTLLGESPERVVLQRVASIQGLTGETVLGDRVLAALSD